MNLFFNKSLGDDYSFSLVLTKETILEFSLRHAETWSSRQLIEVPLVIFTYLPIIFFQTVNTCLIFFLTYSIIKMLKVTDTVSTAFVCFLVLTYTWFDLNSAGWVTTFICMFWGFAVGLICANVAYKSVFYNENTKLSTVLSCIGMIYASNLELVWVYLLVIYVGLIIYSAVVNKKVPAILYFHLSIIVLNAIYTLTSIGNAARSDFTITAYYHDFYMRSFLNNVHEGVYQALLSIFLDVNVYLLVLTVVLVFAIFLKYKRSFISYFYYLLSIVMLIGVFFLNLSYNYLGVRVFFHNNSNINTSNANSLTPYLTFLILCMLFVLIVSCIYIALGHNKKSFMALLTVFASFASASSLGLSAGIAVSGSRAYISLKFGLIVACIMVFMDMYPRLTKIQKTLLFVILSALGVFNFYILIEGFVFPLL